MIKTVALVLLLPLVLVSADGDETVPSQLTERTRGELAQLEVMVDGLPDSAARLSPGEFQVVVDDKDVVVAAVDARCVQRGAAGEGAEAPDAAGPAPAAVMLYFDQAHLTFGGRDNAILTASKIVPELLADGHRIAVVSAGLRLETFANFTTDATVLSDALERMRDDPMQLDDYASTESTRQGHVSNGRRSGQSCSRAREFLREEVRYAYASLEVMSSVLGRFVDQPPPKIAVYFGDTLRIDAGQHFYSLTGDCSAIGFDAVGAFDLFIQDAAAYGVRVYAIQASGLISPSGLANTSADRAAARDAQHGLKALTLDTGGDAFLGGMSLDKMTRRLREDADCLYVLSFDPASFPKDEPLSVRVAVERPGVSVRTRSQVVFLSESARRTSELLAAFSSPETVSDRQPIGGTVIPLEYGKGKFRALVQAVVPQSSLPAGEEWDLGMSLVSGRIVREDAAGRIRVDRPGVSIVLESEMQFRPGAYEVLVVGQETTTQRIASGKINGEWPSFDDGPAFSEVAVLQPTAAAFLRDGDSRTEGSLSLPPGVLARPDRPTMFLTLVCRGDRRRQQITVSRALTGASTVEFEPLALSFEEDACAQVRDVVPAGTMTAGSFSYTLSIDGASEAKQREFHVATAESALPGAS